MANRKPIPHINVPIMQANGSMELAWYLFLQWVSENAGTTDLSDYFTKEETEALLAAKANIEDLATVAFTGDYDDLSDKPTIGDGTITINQGGTQKGTFTVNQSGDTIINLDAGSDIDNLTITKNNDDELQAVGVVNKNIETGATNPIYDWVGTEEEYETQNIATLHPEWLCFITDDCANTESLIVHREVAERNMGELVYSTIPVTDAGLHLADGELLDGTGIYADFYDYMVGVYNAGHTSIFCSEADWQAEVTDHNMCGKYVLDTANHTIRLPSIWGWVEGVRTESKAGTYVPPGLPNITSRYKQGWLGDDRIYEVEPGAITATNIGSRSGSWGHDGNYASRWQMVFDASLSSPVYGTQTADAVQPRGVQVLIYIVIANTVKTPVQVDIDNIATQMNLVTSRTNEMYPHRLVEFLLPTADSNYTWYRKYADGWVEQGGLVSNSSVATDWSAAVVFPIEMSDTNYSYQITPKLESFGTNGNAMGAVYQNTTTGFTVRIDSKYSNAGNTQWASWQVSGMTA